MKNMMILMVVVVLAGLAGADEIKIRTLIYKEANVTKVDKDFIYFNSTVLLLGQKKPSVKKYKKKITDLQNVKLKQTECFDVSFKQFNQAERLRKDNKKKQAISLYKEAIMLLGKRQKRLKKLWLKALNKNQGKKGDTFLKASRLKWPRDLMQFRLGQLEGTEQSQKKVETKKSFSRRFCLVCRGRGKIKCDECRGTGREKCEDCRGNWHKVCRHCRGRTRVLVRGVWNKKRDRRINQMRRCDQCEEIIIVKGRKIGIKSKCEFCSGNQFPGYVKCIICTGKKNFRCTDCNGTGRAQKNTARQPKRQGGKKLPIKNR